MKNRRALFLIAALLLLAGLAWRIPGAAPPGGSPPASPLPQSVLPAARPPASSPSTSPPAPLPHPEVAIAEEGDTLLVRDAVTKAPLSGARVYGHPRSPNFRSGGCSGDLNPPPACLAKGASGITGADGRLSLPGLGSVVVHVIAAGHRWGLPERTEDGLVADLLPGGTVNLSIGRWRELEEPVLFAEWGDVPAAVDPPAPEHFMEHEEGSSEYLLNHSESHPVAIPGPGSDAVTDDGIAAGTWTYFVRRGQRDGEIYARGVVTVAEGETADLRLDAVPVTAGPRVPVKVVAVIPEGWRACIEDWDVEVAQSPGFIAEPTPRFTLKGLDPLNRHLEARGSAIKPDPDGLWRDNLKPDLPAGRYLATVDPPGWVTEVVIEGPAPEVRLELPEPGEVRLTILDAATGKTLLGPSVRWHPPWKGLPRGSVETVDGGLSGPVVLVGSPGTVHVDIQASGYLDAERDLSFIAGSTAEVKVALQPAAILVVRLRLDGKPFEGGGWVEAALKVESEELDRLAGESETGGVVTAQASGFRGGEARIDGLWGGPHEVTVTHLPGFEPVPPRRVEVRFGTVTEVEFELVRAKGE